MRRILTAALASSLLALALPAAASAHHASRHDAAHRARAHRHHHHRHAHMVVLAPSAKPSGTTGTGTPTTPSTEPVASVASFENGVLKLTLPDGSTVSGKVTAMTEIECGGEHHDAPGAGQDQNDDGPGHDQGDDNDGRGQFHGDDEQGGLPQGEENNCGTAALVPGAKVQEAELNVSSAGAIWEKVELFEHS